MVGRETADVVASVAAAQEQRLKVLAQMRALVGVNQAQAYSALVASCNREFRPTGITESVALIKEQKAAGRFGDNFKRRITSSEQKGDFGDVDNQTLGRRDEG